MRWKCMSEYESIGGVFGSGVGDVKANIELWSEKDASKRLSEQPVTATSATE